MNISVNCNKEGHRGKPIQALCIQSTCQQKRACCEDCIRQDHQNHEASFKYLRNLNLDYQKQAKSSLDNMRRTVYPLLFEIEKQIYQQNLVLHYNHNIEGLNRLGNQIVQNDKKQQQIEGFIEQFDQSTIKIQDILNDILQQLLKPYEYSQQLKQYGIEKYNQTFYGEAINYFNDSLNVNGNDHDCWNWKGLSLQAIKQYEKALQCYDEAISIQPNRIEYYGNKVYNLNELGKYQEVIDNVDYALNIFKDNSQNKYKTQLIKEKVFALFHSNRQDEAIALENKLVQSDPTYNNLIILADSLQKNGDQVEALKNYQQAYNYHQTKVIGKEIKNLKKNVKTTYIIS